jgi:16S rRNA (guanine966-N2)-methyltransferase
MRIVGGEFGGRLLAAPRSQAIRPSSDRLRQTLFDILAHGFSEPAPDARVLDLFAGTGALGLESISRGAGFALFVDDGVEARGLIRSNVETLGLTGRTRIFRREVTRLGEVGTMAPFGLVFADPPYGKGLGEQAIASALAGGWLLPKATIVIEEDSRAIVEPPAGLEVVDRRRVGDSQLLFLKPM